MDAPEIVLEVMGGTTPLADLVEAAIRGPLVEAGLSVRPGQVAMARAVAEAQEQGTAGTLAVEAPCGTGKSIGYLLPGLFAVMRERQRSGNFRRMVVSTSGIALQRQIVSKDVPKIGAALGIDISAAVLKGRANYLCLDRLDSESRLIGRDSAQIGNVRRQRELGWSGDRDEIRVHVDPPVWGRLTVSGEECLGESCPHFAVCPAEAAKSTALSAAIVVVNHWYLALAHSRLADGRTVLLVVDEAHDLEDSLRGAGGVTIRDGTARRWVKVLEPVAAAEVAAMSRESEDERETLQATWKNPATEVQEAIGDVLRAAEAHWSGGKSRLSGEWADDPAPGAPDRIRFAADRLRAHVVRLSDEVDRERVRLQARALGLLAERVERVIAPDDALACTWADRNRDRVEVTTAPVSPILPGAWGAVVACSATLGGGADPARAVAEVLGRPRTKGLQVASPWPLREMAVAVVPQGPDPSESSWGPWMQGVTAQVVRMLGGGVLVLCTSLERVRSTAAYLVGEVQNPVRCQGEAGRSELIEWFAQDGNAVLVGSRSMFQGVDVPGNALRGVVIDKVPFPSPGDPMEEAIADRMRLLNLDPFRSRSVAQASTALRQGAGRLIRSGTDRGAIVVTDPRLWRASWGPAVLRALEPFPITRDLDAVARVWGGAPAETEVVPAPRARRVQR